MHMTVGEWLTVMNESMYIRVNFVGTKDGVRPCVPLKGIEHCGLWTAKLVTSIA